MQGRGFLTWARNSTVKVLGNSMSLCLCSNKIIYTTIRLNIVFKFNRMKKVFLLITAILIPGFILAQITLVRGTVAGGEGQVIRLMTYDDFISRNIITLGECKISPEGRFNIEFDLQETIAAFLDINHQRAELFLEPGKTYELEIAYNAANRLESYFDRQGLEYSLSDENPDELNQRIWRFNEMYNKFVMENFEHIVKLHDKGRVSDFQDEVEREFNEIDHPYLQNYIIYKFAEIYQFARLQGKKTLAEEYFTGKPVLYHNVEYTFFFGEFFEKYLTTNPDVITISDLIIAVNEEGSLSMIDEALAQISYLQDEGFRELVLIHGLRGLYFNGTYKKQKVLELIKEIGRSTSDPMHKKITANLIESLGRLAPGSPAPDLLLTGIGGQELHLGNLRGKPILLNFFYSTRKDIQNNFEILAELYNYYRSGLEIISISMDDDPEAYKALANSGGYHWTFAHYGNDPAVLDAYDIRNLPLYVLIDAEGNIAMYPAPPPGPELETAIMKVVH